jgi:cell wall-associated NlpC family hydrolase
MRPDRAAVLLDDTQPLTDAAAAHADLEPTAPTAPSAPDATPRGPRRRRLALAGAAVLALAGGTAAAAGLGGEEAPARPATAKAAGATSVPAAGRDGVVSAETAKREGGAKAERDPDQIDPLAPLPKARPKVVAPVAGQANEAEEAPGARGGGESAEEQMSLPKPTAPASRGSNGGVDTGGVRNLSADTATALPNGVALPPLEAPEAVMQVIRAGNTIARTPYKWGGGHGNFQDSGYDCSGSVTFALYSAGLIGGSATSGALMSYGKPGPGRWITIYTNPGHVFMVVAGIRFDTVGRAVTGSRWQNSMVSTGGYVARHPPGY